MPSSRMPRDRGDGPLLESWRDTGPSGTRAKFWLIARRATATLLVIALVGWLVYLIFGAALQPRTYYAYLPANVTAPAGKSEGFPPSLATPPVEYPYEEFVGFIPLAPALSPISSGDKELLLSGFPSRAALEKQLDYLRTDSNIRETDTLILHLVAHGLVKEGQPYLLGSDYDPTRENAQDTMYPVSNLLEQLASLPGATKLLLLDAGRLDYAPRLGLVENDFASALRTAFAEVKDSSLWVLSAHSPGQRSHVSAALGRSVFGYVVAKGLQGAANENKDEAIDLHELRRFVEFNVSAWVHQVTDGQESQTPDLLGVDANQVASERPHVLFTRGISQPDLETSEEIRTARSGKKEKTFGQKAAAFFTARVGEFGITPLKTWAEKGTSMLVGEDEPEKKKPAEESTEDDAESTAVASDEQIEQDFQEAWRLTQSLAGSSQPHPTQYAPHLWRLHLDQLLWLGQLKESGELTPDVQPRLAMSIRDLKQSLEALASGQSGPPSSNGTVVDRIRALRPTPPLPANQAPTLALASAIATADPAQQLPDKRVEFIRAYDEWLASGESVGFERLEQLTRTGEWDPTAWNDRTWREVSQDYYEFDLLTDLGDGSRVPLQTAKRALQVRRLGERAAADPHWGQGWAADKLAAGDRFRLEAERLLRSRAASRWSELAEDNLERAAESYEEALDQLAAIEGARRLFTTVSARGRDYLRWAPYFPGKDNQQLQDLLTSLGRLRAALDVTKGANVEQVRSEADKLERTHRALESAIVQSVAELDRDSGSQDEKVWRIENALRSPLLPAAARAAYLEERILAEQQLMQDFNLQSPSTQAALKASDGGRRSLPLEWRFVKVYAPQKDRQGLEGSADALSEELAQLPKMIEALTENTSEMQLAPKRGDKLRALREATEALFLVDAVDTANNPRLLTGEVATAPRRLNDARWYDLIVASLERRRRALADSPEEEERRLQQDIAEFANLANDVAKKHSQPRVSDRAATSLAIDLRTPSVSLALEDTATVSLEVERRSGSDSDLWIVAQYDEDLVEVSGPEREFLHEHQLRNKRITGSDQALVYPYQPGRLADVRPLKLGRGDSRVFQFTVTRKVSAGADTNVVFKAIGQDDYLRREVAVKLSESDGTELLVSGGIEASEVDDRGIVTVKLHPNRSHNLRLELRNEGSIPRVLKAYLYKPEQEPAAPNLPRGFVEPLATELVMEAFKLSRRSGPLATSRQLRLNPLSTEPLEIEFAQPAAADSPESSGLALPNLLLVVKELTARPGPGGESVTYEETGDAMLRWIRFNVVEPQYYLTGKANYDASAQRLTVTLRPIPGRLPRERVHAKLEVDPEFVASGRGLGTIDENYITRPEDECVLYVPIREERMWPLRQDLVAKVHVDDYPRAFVFRIPPRSDLRGRDIDPDTAPRIRIRQPRPNTAFQASNDRKSVETLIEVDAPVGFFERAGRNVQVGVDLQEDRNLRNDSGRTFTLKSDRRVDVLVENSGGSNINLAIRSQVQDFRLGLSVAGISKRVNLVAEIDSGDANYDAVHESEVKHYFPIVLDGDGPVFDQITLLPDSSGEAWIGRISVSDDLTRVNSVFAAFDIPGAKELAWVEAEEQGRGEPWVVKLDTKKIPPGEYKVLFKARDAVENDSRVYVSRQPVTISAPPEPEADPQQTDAPKVAAAPPKPVTNIVQGRAIYGRNDVTDLKATLAGGGKTRRARDLGNGQFKFSNVPPGTYQLTVEGRSKGYDRTATREVTVSDKKNDPSNLGNIEIEIPR